MYPLFLVELFRLFFKKKKSNNFLPPVISTDWPNCIMRQRSVLLWKKSFHWKWDRFPEVTEGLGNICCLFCKSTLGTKTQMEGFSSCSNYFLAPPNKAIYLESQMLRGFLEGFKCHPLSKGLVTFEHWVWRASSHLPMGCVEVDWRRRRGNFNTASAEVCLHWFSSLKTINFVCLKGLKSQTGTKWHIRAQISALMEQTKIC